MVCDFNYLQITGQYLIQAIPVAFSEYLGGGGGGVLRKYQSNTVGTAQVFDTNYVIQE